MDNTETRVKALSQMALSELREQWFLLFYTEADSSMSGKLLRLGIAHRIQELAFEATALCEAHRQKAQSSQKMEGKDGCGRAQHMKPGTRILREYKGQVHEVVVIENGRFVYAGRIFSSLSEVAWTITDVRRSGTAFFGLRGRRRRSPDG